MPYHCCMELRHLRYFVAVAEELHFGRAAARLGIAQPPLSMQIRDLETEVGVRLLARTSRRVELTAAGRVFLIGARNILAQLESVISDTQRAHRGETGQLRMGFVSSAAYEVLPSLLRTFRGSYPDVVLRLHTATTLEQVAALRDRRFDLGLLRLPVDDEGLAWRVITEEQLVAVLPASHARAGRDPVPLAALAHESFIMYPRADNPTIHDAIIAQCHQAGFSPHITQESGDMQVITALVTSGIGIALVIASPGLRETPGIAFQPLFGDTIPVWRLALAWRQDQEAPPAVRAFLTSADAVIERLRVRGTVSDGPPERHPPT